MHVFISGMFFVLCFEHEAKVSMQAFANLKMYSRKSLFEQESKCMKRKQMHEKKASAERKVNT